VSASAQPLLRDARERGMRTAIASSSHHCAEILRIGGLAALFDARVDGVDLDRLGLRGKPAPDMFLEAARRLNAPPARAIIFEDATVGIIAARTGGSASSSALGRAHRSQRSLRAAPTRSWQASAV
jgi:alpha,alpha-trehalase